MARPTKYNDKTVKFILDALKAGSIEEDAAAAAGIDGATLGRWKRRDAEFRAAVATAKAEAKVAAVLQIRKAWGQSWKAAAWWLERRYPGEWGKRETLDINIRQEAERIAAETGIDVGRLISLADELKKRRAG